LPERPLHEHAVEPASVLVPDVFERAGRLESRPLVKPYRSGVLEAAADDRDHLAIETGFAFRDQRCEQGGADALPSRRACEIDRILDRMAVGRSAPIGPGIGIAQDRTIGAAGGEIGIAAVKQAAHPPHHLGLVRRLDLEARRAGEDGVGVDGGDGGNVGGRRRADGGGGHGASKEKGAAEAAP